MKSISINIVVAVALIFCLVYFYRPSQSDQSTPAPVAAPSSLTSVGAKTATVRKNELPLMFGGYPCGDDCSQHKAGYRWGMENGINEPDNCDGNTGRFIEGCRVYAEERRTELRSKS